MRRIGTSSAILAVLAVLVGLGSAPGAGAFSGGVAFGPAGTPSAPPSANGRTGGVARRGEEAPPPSLPKPAGGGNGNPRHLSHVFPVGGPFSLGGAGGRFGAPRPGHIHMGQDIAASEGTPLLAVRRGRISWRGYQAGGAGYYLVLAAAGENFNYVYMHLQAGSTRVSQGQHVHTGQRLASVGATGDASGPHLHFEVWRGTWFGGGHAVDPLPFLRRWLREKRRANRH